VFGGAALAVAGEGCHFRSLLPAKRGDQERRRGRLRGGQKGLVCFLRWLVGLVVFERETWDILPVVACLGVALAIAW